MKFNLRILSFLPKLASPIYGRDPLESNPLTDIYNQIVDHALKKFLNPKDLDTVINGYRRSAWHEDALKKDVDKLNSEEHPVPKDEHYWKAINHVAALVKPEVPLKPVHFADLRKYSWRLSTNVGAPFNTSPKWISYVKEKFNHFRDGIPFKTPFSRDLFAEAHHTSEPLEIKDARMTKHNLYNELFFITRKIVHRIKLGINRSSKGIDYKFWNTAFARQHLVKTDEDDKVRLVFGAPFTLLAIEQMFIWPIQVHLLHMMEDSPLLWGYETILGGWYKLRNTFAKLCPNLGTVVTIDWSGFDRYARHTVIRDIHEHIMRPMFTFSEGYHPTIYYSDSSKSQTRPGDPELTFEQKMNNLWSWMTSAILDTPLLMPDGTLYSFDHSGIFSGYMQTQILDSFYNMVMIFTILSRMGFDISRITLKVQGDDSIFLLLQPFLILVGSFMFLFQRYATYYFGAIVSESKSEILEELDGATVLKYQNRQGIPIRDELALLAQLRHPERSTRPEALASRCIGIAFAACGQLPRTYAICEDIYRYLVDVRQITPSQSEMDKIFRYIHGPDGSEFTFDVTRFPSYVETMQHLMDGFRPPAPSHWPLDHFIGLPGRR